jgi:pyruvate-formate lyase-activating enzyme
MYYSRTKRPMKQPDKLPDIPITPDCNYVAAFLTMACPYTCSYCINHFESLQHRRQQLSANDWVRGLSRITGLTRNENFIPITLQGGEPTIHSGFYDIVNNLTERIRLDLLTNLAFNVDEMIARVDPERLMRNAPYASIRVSYHPDQVDPEVLLHKTRRLLNAGFSVGIWAVCHPDTEKHILEVQARAQQQGIDFRTKEFLGYHQNKLYGQYKFPDACSMQTERRVECRTTELLIGPDGHVFRCHHDLYEDCNPLGHILDPNFKMRNEFQTCNKFGHCNPCDIKVKTNRLQQFGHTSVEIRFPEENKTKQKNPTKNVPAMI